MAVNVCSIASLRRGPLNKLHRSISITRHRSRCLRYVTPGKRKRALTQRGIVVVAAQGVNVYWCQFKISAETAKEAATVGNNVGC